MSYCNTKSQEKARYNAVMEVEKEGRSIAQVARRFGCKRSTIYRWRSRYYQLRKEYEIGAHTRHIPTMSSRPKTSPTSLPKAVVEAIIELRKEIMPRDSVKAVLEAGNLFPFKLETIQSDNGGEFGKKFQDEVMRRGMKYRHTRVRRPNDNAHVERFNRTLREECLGNFISDLETPEETKTRLDAWLDYYNHDRIHLGIELMTPFVKCCEGLEMN